MLNICRVVIEDMFHLITKERMAVAWKKLANRFATDTTIPGTKSFNFFLPDISNCISFKRISENQEFA